MDPSLSQCGEAAAEPHIEDSDPSSHCLYLVAHLSEVPLTVSDSIDECQHEEMVYESLDPPAGSSRTPFITSDPFLLYADMMVSRTGNISLALSPASPHTSGGSAALSLPDLPRFGVFLSEIADHSGMCLSSLSMNFTRN